jgi:hypothetical protein
MYNVKKLIHPAVDHGGTGSRAGLAEWRVINGRFSGIPRIISSRKFATPLNKKTGQPDIAACLSRQKQIIEEQIEKLPLNKKKMLKKIVGAGFPGAWLENGRVYPNTVNTNRELEGVHLSSRFSRLMGKGWKTVVNNDGVAHALALSQSLVNSLDRFPRIRQILKRTGKIAGIIPGTGLAGGVFTYHDGILTAVSGPQQIFDIITGRLRTAEDSVSGAGLSFKARRSFLRKRYSKEKLSTQNIGPLLAHLAFSRSKHIKADERRFAFSLYKEAASALARTMWLMNKGGIKGKSCKLVVNDPPSLETDFWENVKGTSVFILGGWLTNPQVKSYMARAIRKELDKLGLFDVVFIFANNLPGVKRMIKSDSVGLTGAALLVSP